MSQVRPFSKNGAEVETPNRSQNGRELAMHILKNTTYARQKNIGLSHNLSTIDILTTGNDIAKTDNVEACEQGN